MRANVSCQGSVPQSIIAFLESSSYEDAIRKAISLGGDADTMACIAGGIAEAFYDGVPDHISRLALALLDPPLLDVVNLFRLRYPKDSSSKSSSDSSCRASPPKP